MVRIARCGAVRSRAAAVVCLGCCWLSCSTGPDGSVNWWYLLDSSRNVVSNNTFNPMIVILVYLKM